MGNLTSTQALERLHELTVIMDKLFQIGSWKDDMLHMGINFDESSRDEVTLEEHIYEIFGNLKDAYDQVKYLHKPIIVEGRLSQVDEIYMIGDYVLPENHDFEVISAPEPHDDDYGNPDFESDPNRTWDYYKDLKQYKALHTAELNGLFVRVRLSDKDVSNRIFLNRY